MGLVGVGCRDRRRRALPRRGRHHRRWARTLIVAGLGIVAVGPGSSWRSSAHLAAPRRQDREAAPRRWRSTVGSAAGREIEERARVAQAEHAELARPPGLPRTPPRRRSGLRAEEAHVDEIEQRPGPAQRAGRRRSRSTRCRRSSRRRGAGDRAEDRRARGAGPDRQGAARPRATRGGGRGRGAPAGPSPRRRGERPRPGGAEPRGRRGGRRPRRAARDVARDLAALRPPGARLRADARGDQHRRAGDDAAGDPLPRAAHGRGHRARSRAAGTAGSASTTPTSGSRCSRRSAADWVPVTELSQGTLDIVYLAARLGLVRLVTGDRRPPLVLDDPFVTLDDARAPRALALLREIAADFQVIYLTTSSRYDALADAVVELPGPTDTDVERGSPPRPGWRAALPRPARGTRRRGSRRVAVGVVASGPVGDHLGRRRLRGRAAEPPGAAVRRRGAHADRRASPPRWLVAIARGEPVPQGRTSSGRWWPGSPASWGSPRLYRGLAVGRMGVVAPTTGVVGSGRAGRRRLLVRGRSARARRSPGSQSRWSRSCS